MCDGKKLISVPMLVRSLACKYSTASRPHKSTTALSLLNSLLVFRLCSYPILVNNANTILAAVSKYSATRAMANFAIKNTLFHHFCGIFKVFILGGENLKEIVPTMRYLKSSNIGSILDLSFEADLEEGEKSLKHALNDAKRIRKLMEESIETASLEPGSFVAVKITAMIPPLLLQRWSNTITASPTKTPVNILDKSTRSTLSLSTPTDTTPDWSKKLYESDFPTIDATYPEIIGLCKLAVSKNVRIMIDAEQTYFQPAIDAITMAVSSHCNTSPSSLIIYNTYQMYLKDTLPRLLRDVDQAKSEGWNLCAKIVRGAYMQSERERAQTLNLPDPVNPNIETTHKQYNDAIELLASLKIPFIVASHNMDSVEHTIKVLEKNNISKQGRVGFAQLLGMQDGITHGLVERGYDAFKYIPYGPVGVTMPYLIRRAQENSGMVSGSGVERDRQELWDELKQRCGFKV